MTFIDVSPDFLRRLGLARVLADTAERFGDQGYGMIRIARNEELRLASRLVLLADDTIEGDILRDAAVVLRRLSDESERAHRRQAGLDRQEPAGAIG